jgi:Ca2+-binding RTX toxin-like protein
VAASSLLSIQAGTAQSARLDASGETDGSFSFFGTNGDDVLKGGAQGDFLTAELGADSLFGGGGGDVITMGGSLTAADRIDGGDGDDILSLSGDYSTELTLDGATLRDIEQIELDSGPTGFSYALTFANRNLPADEALTVVANTAAQVLLDGSAESGGQFIFLGANGDDGLTGGNGNDRLSGGAGGDGLSGFRGLDRMFGGAASDLMNGGADGDVFVYPEVADSTGLGYDFIFHLDPREDSFEVPAAIAAIDPSLNHGTLDGASFDADLAVALDQAHLGAGHAVFFKPDDGDRAGFRFLVVDLNATAGYQGGEDLVICVIDGSHLSELAPADFVAI